MFKPIPGYDDYFISKDGFVLSEKWGKSRILKFRHDGSGYRRVNLYGKDLSIHRLVAMVYMSDFDSNLEVNHIDGDILNNNLENLEMVTHKENMQHAHRIGLVKVSRGETHHLAKLTEKKVLEIRALLDEGNWKQYKIAAKYKVGAKLISEIKRRKAWRHL